MNEITKNIYYAAPYYRISNDDGDLLTDGKEESNSISNQRSLIEEFVKDKPDIILCQERIDDGFSGVDFERPGFKRMLEDIKEGKVNCVIVKDLSRFGRNYIEAGRYIQKIFPYMGVRFIAINDDYDSLSERSQSDHITIPFKNLMNDSYSRDISIKVRSQQNIRRKKGDFIGAFATYGYKKDKDSKNHLVIDEYAASVVRDIFAWKLEGMSNDAIAQKLNSLGIKSPLEYKKMNGMKYTSGFGTSGKASWSSISIKRILTNEVYLGHMVQGKQTTLNHKVKKVIIKRPEEWIKVEHTHEPVIRESDFRTVQKVLQMDTRISPCTNELYIFSGIVKCADCKENMVHKSVRINGKRYSYRVCATHKKNEGQCSCHGIREDALEETVLLTLRQYIRDVLNLKEMIKTIDDLPGMEEEVKKLDLYILKQTEECHRLQKLKVSLYEDLAEGIIDKREYFELKNLYSNEMLELEKQILKTKEEQKELTSGNHKRNEWIEYFLEYKTIGKLNRNMVIKLIDSIEVYENGKIKITFNFQYNYDKAIEALKKRGGVFSGKNQ